MKLSNLTIAPKLGILVGVTLLGLCIAGVIAGKLMKRIDQVHAIVDGARTMALGLQKQIGAGQLTKEAAITEFTRRAQSITYDNGDGYLYAYTMEGIVLVLPDPKAIGTDRLGLVINGRQIIRELRDGVAKG